MLKEYTLTQKRWKPSEPSMQVPQDAQELQSFLGIATYMAPFIANMSALSNPLRNLFKKGTDFHWSPSHSTVFEKIKQ